MTEQKEMLQNIHYCVMLGLSEKTKEKVNFFIWRFVPAVQSVQYEKGMLDWYVQRNGFILWTELCRM